MLCMFLFIYTHKLKELEELFLYKVVRSKNFVGIRKEKSCLWIPMLKSQILT